MIKRLMLLAMSAVAAPAMAGTADYGSISILFAVPNAIVFWQNGGRNAAPSCATGGYAVEANTVAGQSAVAMLMAAYAMRKRIWIQGTGNCSVWSDRETVDWFAIEG